MMPVPIEVIEEYSYGKCMWLALALHDRYGWDIHAQLDKDGSIAHAYVKRPDGKEVDVCGVQERVDIFNGSGKSRRFSREGFIRFLKGMSSHMNIMAKYRREKVKADRVIDLYF